MAFLYLTPAARRRRDVREALENLRDDLAARTFDDAIRLFEFRPPYRYKRLATPGGAYRIIARPAMAAGSEVIVVLDVLKRDERAWEEFNNSAGEARTNRFEPLLDWDDLEQQVRRSPDRAQPETARTLLPQGLMGWLSATDLAEADALVLESPQWVDCMASAACGRDRRTYANLVTDAVNRPERGTPICEGSRVLRLTAGNCGCGISYAVFPCVPTSLRPGGVNVLYLLAPLSVDATGHKWLDERDAIRSLDDLERRARRSYPQYLLADQDSWCDLQQHDGAVCALSEEEGQLLSGLPQSGSRSVSLPIFISGRAGSGKSTVLHALFADYIERYRRNRSYLQGELLFVTCSRRLLDAAVQSVRRQLSIRSLCHTGSADGAAAAEGEEVARFFRTFDDLVCERIPAADAATFRSGLYIDYRRFTELYQAGDLPQPLAAHGLHALKDVPPELAWHVIRTFIKGYHADRRLTPEDYADLPHKEQTVSLADYRAVFEQVWQPWYRYLTEQKGFWDIQDAVCNILARPLVDPAFAVVFCDEAQDLTRVELGLLLRLLAYRDFDLGWEKRIQLPLVLAGDASETFHPSRLRWEGLKASIASQVSADLDPRNRGTVELSFQELTYNYRSPAPLVRLSNLLLLWREVLCGMSGCAPQECWRATRNADEPDQALEPLLFVLGENLAEDDLAQVIAHSSAVIIPCEPGQEQEFMQADAVMSRAAATLGPRPILAPAEAKGAEFETVLLYGFGRACPPDLFLATGSDDLARQRYLNNLHVAITRARHRLLIVDTPEGERMLWRHARSASAIAGCVGLAKQPGAWQAAVGGVEKGHLALLDAARVDPRPLAEELRTAGARTGNAYLLHRASALLRSSDDVPAAVSCEATVLELEGCFDRAGMLFEQLSQPVDAERCYWRGMLWGDLQRVYMAHAAADEWHRLTCALMTSADSDSPEAVYAFAGHLLAQSRQGVSLELGEAWLQAGCRECIRRFAASLSAQQVTAAESSMIAELLDRLAPLHAAIGLDLVAQCYYGAQRYADAVHAWESMEKGAPACHDYYVAKANVTDWPTSAHWWHEVGDYQAILSQYERDGARNLAEDTLTLELVARAYIKGDQPLKAAEIQLQLRQASRAARLLGEALGSRTADDLSEWERGLVTRTFVQTLMQGNHALSRDMCSRVSQWLPREELFLCELQLLESLLVARRIEEALALASAGTVRNNALPAFAPAEQRRLEVWLVWRLMQVGHSVHYREPLAHKLTKFVFKFVTEDYLWWQEPTVVSDDTVGEPERQTQGRARCDRAAAGRQGSTGAWPPPALARTKQLGIPLKTL